MAKPTPTRQTIQLDFTMVDQDGTAKLRAVATHAESVGNAWLHLGREMAALADRIDVLAERSDG